MSRSATSVLALAIAALSGALAVQLLAPAPVAALGAGMSLDDRVALAGTPVRYYVRLCNDPDAPRVPEGRRLLVYGFTIRDSWTCRNAECNDLQVSFAGYPLIDAPARHNGFRASKPTGPPLVLEAGEPIVALKAGVLLENRCELSIDHAWLL